MNIIALHLHRSLLTAAVILCALSGQAQTAPAITTQPTSAMVSFGSPVSLTAAVAGTGVGCQWLKDGVLLPGQTNTTLSFGSFLFANCGSYKLVATNAHGVAISYPAYLTLPGTLLESWGYNGYGELADGDYNQQTAPVIVATNVVAASANFYHSLFVTSDGRLWASGSDVNGQLGIGAGGYTNAPAFVTNNVAAVAAGYVHSLFVRGDGTLWAMGDNRDGQLGNGATNNVSLPIPVATNVVAAAAGYYSSLFVSSNGTLYAMGLNSYGQLGNGATNNVSQPVAVATNVVTAVLGQNHALFIKADGMLWAMGDNSLGQFGNGTTNGASLPVVVASNAVAITAGASHSLYVDRAGTLWATGNNGNGQFGNGTTVGTNRFIAVASNVVAVAAGAFHTLEVRADATVSSVGYNSNGQLGLGNTSQQTIPVPIPNLAVAILGPLGRAYHSLAVAMPLPQMSPLASQTNFVGQPVTFALNVTNGPGPFTYQWQFNGTNLLGATNSSYTLAAAGPYAAGLYTGIVTGLAGSASTSATLTLLAAAVTNQPAGGVVTPGTAVTISGGVGGTGLAYQWLKDGAILPGQTNSSLTFTSFQFTNSGNYQLVATNLYGMAITLPASWTVTGAPALACGLDNDGQLGPGFTTLYTNRLRNLYAGAAAVSEGAYHTLLVGNDGALFTFGFNRYGQLGTGNTNNSSSRNKVATGVVAVAAGAVHSLFLKSDGTLWAMGDNSVGQLGTGNNFQKTSPVSVASNVVAVAAGNGHVLELHSDGTLWGTGLNADGELGLGNTNNTSSPLPVASGVVAMAAGAFHSLFLKGDGTLWAMGYNNLGQLGNGTNLDSLVPVCVASNVTAVAAGSYCSFFVKNDGTLWGMGNNGNGQLGIGNPATSYLPAFVASNVVAAASGYYHSLIEKGDGTLWVMGYNSSGQLGTGDYGQQNYPVPIPGITVASLGSMQASSHSLLLASIAPQVAALASQFITVGQGITLTQNTTNGTGPFGYQWLMNGTNIPGANAFQYAIAAAGLSDAGVYSCVVTGFLGAASSSMRLTVYSLSGQPSGGLVTQGQSVTLSATGSNGQPFGYQWLKDGVILAGQTNSSLTLASFQFTNCGGYVLVLTNAAGMVLSRPVFLTLAGAPLQDWGANANGALGIGSTVVNVGTPTNLSANVVAVTAGSSFAMYLKNDGSLWAMGNNGYGQFGIGSSSSTQKYPQNTANNVVAAAAGLNFAFYIKSDGTLWAAGNNAYGQLGIGTFLNTNLPEVVANNVSAVAAGYAHGLFITMDGTLWAMGLNASGQLGNGANANTNVPVAVASNVVAVAAGYSHSLFVKSDGTLWGVGSGGFGNLPSFVASNVVAVAAGANFSLFLTSDGLLWGFGSNGSGQLGLGALGSTATPVVVTNNVVAVTAGANFSLHVKNDGTLWAMGDNLSGELGIGYGYGQKYPTLVPGLEVASLGAMDQANLTLAVAAVMPQFAPLPGQFLIPGQPLAWAVNVTNGTAPFTYQWLYNGANLPGATNSSFTLPAVARSDSGLYTVTVAGTAGAASSSAAVAMALPKFTLALNPGATSGAIQFNLPTGLLAGVSCVLQATTNLVPPVQWLPLQTNAPDASGACPFTVTNLAVPGRFYRIVLP